MQQEIGNSKICLLFFFLIT